MECSRCLLDREFPEICCNSKFECCFECDIPCKMHEIKHVKKYRLPNKKKKKDQYF